MFCSIEDAWGEKSFTDKQIFKQSDRPEHFENNQSKEQLYSKYMELKDMFGNESNQINEIQSNQVEHFGNESHQPHSHHSHQPHQAHHSHQVCAALDAHMRKCSHCRRKYGHGSHAYSYQAQPYSFDLSNLSMGIRSNKDIVTIFLFGLLVILLLQLFSK